MKHISKLFFISLIIFSLPLTALAGEGATLIFKSGQVVQISDGYLEISRAMMSLDKTHVQSRVIELNIGGNTFIINMSEVALICRDKCTGLKIIHQLDPSRGKSR